MRRSWFHFAFVSFFTLFLGVILPAHSHGWLRMDDDDDALETMSTPAPGQKDLPHDDQCAHCAFCQFAAHISHSPAMPVIVPSLLPLNYLFIISLPVYVPADLDPTSDARGPPAAAASHLFL